MGEFKPTKLTITVDISDLSLIDAEKLQATVMLYSPDVNVPPVGRKVVKSLHCIEVA